MKPKYEIRFYDATDVLKHTITSGSVRLVTHRGVNDDCVGSFELTLPTKTTTFKYTDIVPYWKIKVWLSWQTVDTTATPVFAGRVNQIMVPPVAEAGYVRIIKGQTFSEVLQRRIKSRKVYAAAEVDDIIADVISDLVLGNDTDVDTTAVTLTIDQEPYLDLLRRISDYWYDAATQIKKEFFVDVGDAGHTSGHLVWKARPIRTSGVETLTEGANLIGYNIFRDGSQIKNSIKVYGRKVPFVGTNDTDNRFLAYQIYGRKYPTDGDDWTWKAATWTDVKGVTSQQNATPDPAVGTDYLQSDSEDVNNDCEFHIHHDQVSSEGYDGYGAIEFWGMRWGAMDCYLRLYCPDDTNYYELRMLTVAAAPHPQDPFGNLDDTWKFHRYSIGSANTYDATSNPTGRWHPTGSPDWENIFGIEFQGWSVQPDMYMGVDGLCYNFGRWRYSTSDATSITNYGQRDLVVIDDTLNSDAECESRSKTHLYRQKEPVIRLDCLVNGNNNILLGDRLSMTIAAEGISATNYYVTGVDQVLEAGTEGGWKTRVTMVDNMNNRSPCAIAPLEVMMNEMKRNRDIGKGTYAKIS